MVDQGSVHLEDDAWLETVLQRIEEAQERGETLDLAPFLAQRPHLRECILVLGDLGRDVRPGRTDAPSVSAGWPQLPGFEVLAELGTGGMGTVYLAEQREPIRRRVALKVIKLGMDTKAVLARFEAERQALALMDHPSIAKVFEAGATPDGRPYFAMEYVKGMPITRYCDDQRLAVEERLRLFRQVCSGVQHAHQKGVIHRDLTPNNVLVAVQDGKAVAKIIDFGLARATDHRLTEKTLFTEQGVILGTPEYMSPEQAGLNALDIDMRSDVYTLGVLLYELLTGALPFSREQLRQAGYDKMCAIIRTQEPERPSTRITKQAKGTEAAANLRRTDADKLLRRLRGDLDWVVLKCLEKDRTRRYETVSALADDVQRHLDTEPVLARAPTFRYRLGKFARRHRGRLVAAGLVLGALLAGLAGTTVFMLRAQDSEARAVVSAGQAKRQEDLAREQARAAELARVGEAAKAKEAAENAEEARRNAERFEKKVVEFDQLAGVVLYERAVENEKELYPAWPHKVEAMARWLQEDAGPLLAMRQQIAQTVADLRGRTLPLTDAERERDRTTHPRYAEWQAQVAKLASLEQEAKEAEPTDAAREARAGLRESLTKLEAEIGARRTYRFADEPQAFLHDTLSDLLSKLASLDGSQREAVERRLSWAKRIVSLTLGHPQARATWQQAREAIKMADGIVASELYREQKIELRDQDVVGLVPIGMNPATKLWEFYDLASAWDGVRDPASLTIPRYVTKGDDAGHIDVGDDTGIVFVLLPGGEFAMGTQAEDSSLPSHDRPRRGDEALHDVTLSPFFLARHELTQGQWRRLSRGETETPSYYPAGGTILGVSRTWSNPVERVDWDMCVGLLRRHGMVLPTEAQWEYGCRAGTTTPWVCALEDLVRYANVADATAKRASPSWSCEAWSDGHVVHAPVGSFLPNAFGLFDMHGNVWEWTRDGDHGAGARPRAGDGLRGDPDFSTNRILRGGGFNLAAQNARSALRDKNAPSLRGSALGLRPARALQP